VSTDFNVFDFWKDFYKQSSSYLDERISESFPSQGIGQILDMNLHIKKILDESTERYLQMSNVPSRKDISNIAAQIVNVDAKVDRLEELLEEELDTKANLDTSQQEIMNLKEEMQILDQKLNQILVLLESK
jgi:polyhydroxyalkanoic acid synthase PhaR subunit